MIWRGKFTNKRPPIHSYAATYAYSLYVQEKEADALKVMQQLKPQELEVHPSRVITELILKAAGDGASAKVYLDKAAKARLLPEERKLFDQAKAGI